MQLSCEKCGESYQSKPAPCPDGREGCLAAHYDNESFVCVNCRYDMGPVIAKILREGGIIVEEAAMMVINSAAVAKLEFEEPAMEFSILGLVGPAGSGKDLVADWFVENQRFAKLAFADPMKRFVLRAFPGITVQQLWGPSEERNREIEIDQTWWFEAIGHFGPGAGEIVQDVLESGDRVSAYSKLYEWFTQLRKNYSSKISARVILQTLGTEWGRNVDPLLWAKFAHKVINILKKGDHKYNQVTGITSSEGHSYGGVIIPDHRYQNEISLTQDNGGYVIRLNRKATEKNEGNVGIQGHSSEVEMRDIPTSEFDFVLDLSEGIDKVHWALETIAKDKPWEIKRRTNDRLP